MTSKLIGLLAVFLASCSAVELKVPADLDRLLPQDAREVNRSSPGHWKQISFVVERTFPEFAFAEKELAPWIQAGWIQCKSNADEWSSYIDEATGKVLRIHQKTIHMLRGNEVLLLGGRYSSEGTGTEVSGSRAPDSTIQHGLIISMKGSSDEVKNALAPFQARCP